MDAVRLSVQNGGTQLNRHRTLNFGTGLAATESSANKRIDVTLAGHDHSGDAGDGGTFDAANLTSGAATDGQVLTADGAGAAAWEGLPALADHDHTGDAGDGGILASYGRPVFLTSPLTSTSWDGDAHSTEGATLIDLSAVFGTPANVRAVLAFVEANDSGSAAATNIYVGLGPSSTNPNALVLRLGGFPNDVKHAMSAVVPCDANGDIYYIVSASGGGTMDVWLRVWGYWL
jgi:hypothetical protein